MKIGCPKEIKPQEFRIGMTPIAAREAVAHGHDVLVETGAGVGAGFADADYVAAGVDKGDIGGDEAVFFKPLGAAVAGRGREVHAFGQFGVGDAPFLLQNREDAAVGCVEF